MSDLSIALAIAVKKAAILLIYESVLLVISLPVIFSGIGLALGPHLVSGIGAVMGSAIRFHILKMPIRQLPAEAAAAAGLGILFGQATIPGVTSLLEKVSPDMFPLAHGAAIGLLMAAGTGFVRDASKKYMEKLGGSK